MDFNARHFHEELRTSELGRFALYRPEVDSTMRLARREADEGAPHGTLVVAERQTAGQARHGRTFLSSAGGNLYISLVLCGDALLDTPLPLVVPVALARACRAAGVEARIKWPDDIWVGERKLGGTMIDLVTGAGESTAIIGIGMNVNGDPAREHAELKSVATSIHRELGRPADRERVLALICNNLEEALAESPAGISGAYRADSMILGHRVVVRDDEGTRAGTATGITETGTLVVDNDEGTREELSSAEVFVVRREDTTP